MSGYIYITDSEGKLTFDNANDFVCYIRGLTFCRPTICIDEFEGIGHDYHLGAIRINGTVYKRFAIQLRTDLPCYNLSSIVDTLKRKNVVFMLAHVCVITPNNDKEYDMTCYSGEDFIIGEKYKDIWKKESSDSDDNISLLPEDYDDDNDNISLLNTDGAISSSGDQPEQTLNDSPSRRRNNGVFFYNASD